MSDVQRDREGYRVIFTDWGGYIRVTECCGASSTFTGDGEHVCRKCYALVDLGYGDTASMDGVTA